MKLYMLLSFLSGFIIIEGVVVELLAVIEKKVPHPMLTSVTDLGRYLNRWVLPMAGLAVAGALLLKLGDTYPLGGLLKVAGSAVYSLFLVVFLVYITSEPRREDIFYRR